MRQTKYVVRMTKEGSTKIVTFMTSRAGFLMLDVAILVFYSEYVLSSTLSIYSTLIAIVWRDYDAAYLFIFWFLFILWWGCWYTNISPSDKKSLILSWPERPVGLLLLFPNYLPFWKGMAHLNKLEFPSPGDTLCQAWLKLVQWFWRRRFLKVVNLFWLFTNYLLFGKGVTFHLNKLESHSPRDTLCKGWLKLAQWFWRRRWKC